MMSATRTRPRARTVAALSKSKSHTRRRRPPYLSVALQRHRVKKCHSACYHYTTSPISLSRRIGARTGLEPAIQPPKGRQFSYKRSNRLNYSSYRQDGSRTRDLLCVVVEYHPLSSVRRSFAVNTFSLRLPVPICQRTQITIFPAR